MISVRYLFYSQTMTEAAVVSTSSEVVAPLGSMEGDHSSKASSQCLHIIGIFDMKRGPKERVCVLVHQTLSIWFVKSMFSYLLKIISCNFQYRTSRLIYVILIETPMTTLLYMD